MTTSRKKFDAWHGPLGYFEMMPSKLWSFFPVSCICAVSLADGSDLPDGSVEILSLPYTDTGSTAGAANDFDGFDGAGCPFSGSTAPEVFYKITGSGEVLTISLCDSEYDTKVYVLDDTLSLFACNDDSCGVDGFRSELITPPLVDDATYWISVDGYAASSGNYLLNVDTFNTTPSLRSEIIIGEKRYQIRVSSFNRTWYEMRAEAQALGGDLVCFETESEYNEVMTALNSQNFPGDTCAFGLFQDPGNEPLGGWRWINGEPLTWTAPWAGGEPNNNPANEDAGQLYSTNLWNDARSIDVKWNTMMIELGEDGPPPPGECPEDLDQNDEVGLGDLLTVLSNWGCTSSCDGSDLDQNGEVGLGDLLALLSTWGPCKPQG